MLEDRATSLRERAHRLIPGGAHTYSKGDDQFPSNAPAFIARGSGSRVWDQDGREFLDWGMGLRSVILGHAHPRVVEAVTEQVALGSNFTRPSVIESEVAERLVELVPCAEMVKFAKNGSDVTTGAVRLARAFTGRDMVVFPKEHPFHSFDDWFIGSTVMDAGVPEDTKRLSATFTYGDVDSLEALFAEHGPRIACVVMEPATSEHPPEGYLQAVRGICDRAGALLVFDEMITGFRWHTAGAQAYYGVTPDMATFGKGIANGFSVAALVGRRDLLAQGGLAHDGPRVFLLSATNGGETHSLAAARETIGEIVERDVTAHLWRIGEALQHGLAQAIEDAGAGEAARVEGLACSPILAFGDPALRTLFLQETVEHGVLIPYIAPSQAHGDEDVAVTVEAARAGFERIRRVLDGEPLESHLRGDVVRPVFRRFNTVDLDA